MSIPCDNNIYNTMDYLDGSLSDSQRIEFEVHIHHCTQCRKLVDVVSQGRQAAKAADRYIPSQLAPVNAKMAIHLMARRQKFLWPRRVAFTGACACIVTLSMLVWHPHTQQNTQYGINKLLNEDHVSWQSSEAFSDPALAEIRAAEHL